MAQLTMANSNQDSLFNSMYGGYAGPGGTFLPPPAVLMNSLWDDEKIETTVKIRYVRTQLSNVQQKRLDEPLDGGELTDSTYGEWIIERSKKLFVILAELGEPDKIFDLIDRSWDDDDLPLTQESLERIGLSTGLARRFWKKQHLFLLRDLGEGAHIEYEGHEYVPLEVIFKPTARGTPALEKVYYPRKRDTYYTRRRILLGDPEEPDGRGIAYDAFLDEIRTMKSLSHPHIVSIYASYTHQSFGYLLLCPQIELNLRSFLIYPSVHFKNLSKAARKTTLLDWLHCLSEALAFLHEEHVTHADLKPSSIIIDATTSRVFLSDIGNARVLDPKTTTLDIEAYEYAAPELHVRSMTSHEQPMSTTGITTIVSGRTRRTRRASDERDLSPTSTPVVRLGTWSSMARLDPRSADVFSLAAVFLDILTFYSKRKASAFSSHRAAKNRRPRESAPPDASFHSNMTAVETWIEQLEKQARKKGDAGCFHALEMCRGMMERDSRARPTMRAVEEEIYRIVMFVSEEPPHCGAHVVRGDSGMGPFGGGWATFGRDSGTSTEGEHESSIHRGSAVSAHSIISEESMKSQVITEGDEGEEGLAEEGGAGLGKWGNALKIRRRFTTASSLKSKRSTGSSSGGLFTGRGSTMRDSAVSGVS